MIKATVFKNSTDSGNAVYTGIVMEGHAGYADEGEDIICAAVSALALNFSIQWRHLRKMDLKAGRERAVRLNSVSLQR